MDHWTRATLSLPLWRPCVPLAACRLPPLPVAMFVVLYGGGGGGGDVGWGKVRHPRILGNSVAPTSGKAGLRCDVRIQ